MTKPRYCTTFGSAGRCKAVQLRSYLYKGRPTMEILEQIDLGLWEHQNASRHQFESVTLGHRRRRTIISGSSAAGMLLSPICLTATVSPVCQFRALHAASAWSLSIACPGRTCRPLRTRLSRGLRPIATHARRAVQYCEHAMYFAGPCQHYKLGRFDRCLLT